MNTDTPTMAEILNPSPDAWHLECIADTGEGRTRVRVYRIRRPGTLMGSTLLMEAAGQITIAGDLCPGRNGVVSTLGYGLDWFARQLGGSYLAEKFLSKRWVPALAARWVTEVLAGTDEAFVGHHNYAETHREALEDLGGEDNIREMGEVAFYEALSEIDSDIMDDEPPGWDYEPTELRCLVAIQARFAKLWADQAGAASTELPEHAGDALEVA